MPEKIVSVYVAVQTEDENKEDSQFELYIYQGPTLILQLHEGAGQNWDDGDYREFDNPLDVDVTNELIRVIAGLRDGDWGRSNHWNATIDVVIRSNANRQLFFRRFCAFRTRSSRRNHQVYIGSGRFGTHGVPY
jgi:hypothetical protein